MRKTETLSDFQSAAIDDVLYTVKAVASYKNIKMAESPPLDVVRAGVKLHFLRLGLFPYDTEYGKDHFIIHAPDENSDYNCDMTYDIASKKFKQTLEEVVVQTQLDPPKGATTPKNYEYRHTTLNEGYIYIFDDENKDFHKEYYVNSYSQLINISWESKNNKKEGAYKDVRKPTPRDYKRVDDGHLVHKNNAVLWVAFSTVQWSVVYHEKLRTNCEYRANRMKKITCSGIEKGVQNEEAAHVDNVFATFAYENHAEAQRFKDKLERIAADEKQQKDDFYEDMFVTLHDPLSCAYKICEGIDREVTRLKSIIASIQTGKPDYELFPLLQEDKEIPKCQSIEETQIQYLHILALISYKFIFDNPELKERHHAVKTDSIPIPIPGSHTPLPIKITDKPFYINSGVSREKIEKVLGVKERKAQRTVINSYRNDLGDFMESDYYQNLYDDYIENIGDHQETAKILVADHKLILGMYPNYFDRDLDLKEVYQPQNDKWYIKIGKTWGSEKGVFEKSTAILDKAISLGSIINLSLEKKTVSTLSKISKAYADHGDFSKGMKSFTINKKLCYLFRDFETREAVIRFPKLENFDEYLAENKKEVNFYINEKELSLKEYKNVWHKKYANLSKSSAKNLIEQGKVALDVKNIPKRHTASVKRFLNTPAIASVVLLMEILAERKISMKHEGSNSRFHALEVAGARIKVAAAIGELTVKANLYNSLKTTSKRRILRGVSTLKIAGSLVTVLNSVKDGYYRYQYRDYDSMAAYGLATVAGGIFLAGDVSVFFGSSAIALGFWPAAVVGGIFIGACFLASYLKDSDIEAFFKNYPFSDYGLDPSTNQKPFDYIKQMIGSRKRLVTDKFPHLADFERANAEIMDMITPNTIILEPQYPEYGGYFKDKFNCVTNKFKASIYLAQYFDDSNELELQAWFYPQGIRGDIRGERRKEITMFQYDFPKSNHSVGKSNGLAKCKVSFQLPFEYSESFYDYKYGEVLFMVRLKVSPSEFIPLQFKSEKRFYVANARVVNQVNTDQRYLRTPAGIMEYGTTNELIVRLDDTPENQAARIIEENEVPYLVSFPTNRKER